VAPVLALGIFLATLALIVVTGRAVQPFQPEFSRSTPDPTMTPVSGSMKGPAPLELIALGQVRDDDSITVTGMVRNPTAGARLDRLSAVVLLFSRSGEFLGTGRGALEFPTLTAGSESAFTISVASAREVGRYRIRFRSDDKVVPHVDRRNRGSDSRLN
jgi:hypothetical protein